MTNSQRQETEIAKLLDGKVQSNSGGTKFGGGDILTKYFLIEAKTKDKPFESFSIKKSWLDKAAEQAWEQGKTFSAVAFRFSPNGDDYFVIDSCLMLRLVELIREDWGND